MTRTPRPETPEDARLVPVLNLANIVVPVTIMLLGLASSAAYELANPAPVVEQMPAAHIDVRIEITEQGFVVHGARGVFASESHPLPDQEALFTALQQIKAAYPMEREVTIIPRPRTPYMTIMRTMDTSRVHFTYVKITSGE